MSTDNDITPEPTAVSDELEKFRKAFSALLDGKVETRLHRMKYDGVETAAIVMKRPLSKGKERVVPLFVAVTPAVLDRMSTMWDEPLHSTRPEAPVRAEPKMIERAEVTDEELADLDESDDA